MTPQEKLKEIEEAQKDCEMTQANARWLISRVKQLEEKSNNTKLALEEAADICKTGAKYGIEECQKWLKKWVRNEN
jgi:hypothetical protein